MPGRVTQSDKLRSVDPFTGVPESRFQAIWDLFSLERIIVLAIRSGLGFMLGFLIGIAALLLTLWGYPGRAPMWVLVYTGGIGAGIAGFLAFLKPESSRRVILISLAVTVIGGIAGSWLGSLYAEIVYPEGVRNVYFISYGTLRSPAVVAFVTGGAIVSTITGAVYYAFRLWRYHEV